MIHYSKREDTILCTFIVSCLILAMFGVWKVIEILFWVCSHVHWE